MSPKGSRSVSRRSVPDSSGLFSLSGLEDISGTVRRDTLSWLDLPHADLDVCRHTDRFAIHMARNQVNVARG